jgi:hypothetical protein
VRNSKLEVGDRVLVRISAKTGKAKLSDKWERDPYIVIDIPNPEIPVYRVQKESGKGKVKTLHRNLLLPFMYISDSLTDERPENKPDQRKSTRSSGRKVESSDTSSSSDDDDLAFYQPQRSGTRNKPVPNTSRINRANDFVESSGSQGTTWFDSRGSLPNMTQFEPVSTVVSDPESPFPTESINNTDSSAVPDENGDVSVPCLDFVPRRSTRRRNNPDRYGDWVMNSQQVYYV